MKIKVLDGKNVIGGTKILIQTATGDILLDFGINFKRWSEFFEEYLQPRTSVGIYDFWKLGLIPKFSNLYREDMILSDFRNQVITEEALNLKTILLTHAHVDHSGFIPLIRGEIPVITSLITKKILQAMQETGDGKATSQYVFLKNREETVDEHGQIKLETSKNGIKTFRTYYETSDENSEFQINGIKIKTFPVDHSIPGAISALVEVEGTKIAYTGDLRFHGKNGTKTREFINEIAKIKPDVLITEGTRVQSVESSENDTYLVTEEDVYLKSKKAVDSSTGKLVIADFGPRNIERLETFLHIAKETKRRLLITTKDAYILDTLKECGMDFIDDENLSIITDKKIQKRGWIEKIKENYGSKYVKMKELEKNQGDYILSFSFWDLTNLLDMNIDSGIYIYSTSEAFSEEQIIDTKRLLNWINFYNLTPFGIGLNKKGEPEFSHEFHSSGHTSCRDLFEAIEQIKPKYLIPVHTEHIETFVEHFKEEPMHVIIENDFEL